LTNFPHESFRGEIPAKKFQEGGREGLGPRISIRCVLPGHFKSLDTKGGIGSSEVDCRESAVSWLLALALG